MINIKNTLYALLLVLLVGACSTPHNPSLRLSVDQLSFASSLEAEQSIDVIASVDDWTAFPEASWIKVSRSANKLIVHVEENTSIVERNAEVKVLADGLLRSVKVMQVGSGRSISLIPSEYRVDQFGGKTSIFVKSNYQDWTVTCDADWVTIDPQPERNTIGVTVTENKDEIDRVATITLSNPDRSEVATYTLRQDAILTLILPSLEFGISPVAIREFEASRYSDVIKIPDGLLNTNTWGFKTISPIFDRVEYTFDNDTYSLAKLYAKDKATMASVLDRFIALLLEKGFVFDYEGVYVNEALSARVRIEANLTQPYVAFQLDPKQSQPYPTFENFPFGLLRYGLDDAAVIEEYEQANGGTLLESRSKATYRFYTINDGDWIHRAYYLSATSGKKIMSLKNINLAVFLYGTEPFLTNEFKALMAKEGFVLSKYDSSFRIFTFKNTQRNMSLDVRIGKSLLDATDPVLFFNLTY